MAVRGCNWVCPARRVLRSERAFVMCRWLEVVEVLGDKVLGEHEVVGVAATPCPHAAQDRLAIVGHKVVPEPQVDAPVARVVPGLRQRQQAAHRRRDEYLARPGLPPPVRGGELLHGRPVTGPTSGGCAVCAAPRYPPQLRLVPGPQTRAVNPHQLGVFQILRGPESPPARELGYDVARLIAMQHGMRHNVLHGNLAPPCCSEVFAAIGARSRRSGQAAWFGGPPRSPLPPRGQ